MEKEKNLTGSQRVENKLDSFIGKNRKILLIVGIVVLVAVIAVCVAVGVVQSNTEKKFNALAELEGQYETIASLDSTSAEYSDSVAAFTTAADSLISSASLNSYPGA